MMENVLEKDCCRKCIEYKKKIKELTTLIKSYEKYNLKIITIQIIKK